MPLSLLVAVLAACGGSSTEGAAAAGVGAEVRPPVADVAPGGTVQFSALVTGTANTAVEWSILESNGGSFDQTGTYVAPQAYGTYHVLAKVVSAPSVTATAIVNVTPPAPACATTPLRTTGTVYYYCDCQAGASAGCIAGTDSSSNNTSPSTPQRSLAAARSKLNALNAGETVALCRGGAWSEAGGDFGNSRCTVGSPCEFRDYVPAWGSASSPRPILNIVGTHGFQTNGTATDGMRFWNFDMRLPLGEPTHVGFAIRHPYTNVDICNVAFDGGRSGIDMGIATASVDTKLTIRNNQFTNAAFSAVAGGAPGLLVDSNRFAYNGPGDMFEHTVYLYADSSTAPVQWYQRYINNDIVVDSRSTGVALVVHGRGGNRMLIENNRITVESGNAYGIQLSSSFGSGSFFESVVRRNRVIYSSASDAMGLEVSCCRDCTVEDNIVHQGRILIAGDAGGTCNSTPAFQSARITARNNSMYLTNAYSGHGGIKIGFGTGHVVENNAVWVNGSNCFTDATGATFSNNYCRTGGGAPVSSVFVDAPNRDYRPTNPGPLVGAANQTSYSPLAIGSVLWDPAEQGLTRVAPIDIGAMEH